jgi:hypothetical protein
LTSASLVARSASAFGLSPADCGSVVLLDEVPEGIGVGGTDRIMRAFLRIVMAVAAAAAAASSAVPAITFGQRRDCCLGGSSFLAATASMAETLGATVSCIETLLRAALTAIHARALPTCGLAHVAALPARRLAVLVALFVMGAARSASLDACMAIFLARHCISAAGMMARFPDVTDTDSSPVNNLHRELPRSCTVNRAMPRS